MNHLAKLFKLIEVTRSMPQYGYALGGIPKEELSGLAEHHYLVAFIAWQLARNVKRSGANINVEKTLAFAMVHDLGELFGGDISWFYGRANKAARTAAKTFERENQKFLAKFFGEDGAYFNTLSEEILDAKSDEALIAKLADYIECHEYKKYVGALTKRDIGSVKEALARTVRKIKDPLAKKKLKNFLVAWARELPKGNPIEVVWEKRK